MTDQEKRLRNISHGIYLQIFLGVGAWVSGALFGKLPDVFSSPAANGGLLILLGLNSLVYINKYKKSLSSDN